MTAGGVELGLSATTSVALGVGLAESKPRELDWTCELVDPRASLAEAVDVCVDVCVGVVASRLDVVRVVLSSRRRLVLIVDIIIKDVRI